MGHHLWWNVIQPQTRATVQQICSACFMSLMQNRTIPLLHAGKLLIVRELVLLFLKRNIIIYLIFLVGFLKKLLKLNSGSVEKDAEAIFPFSCSSSSSFFNPKKKKKKPDKHKLIMALDTALTLWSFKICYILNSQIQINFCRRRYFWVKPMELLEWAVCIPIEQFWQDIYLFTKVCYFKYYKSTFSNQWRPVWAYGLTPQRR